MALPLLKVTFLFGSGVVVTALFKESSFGSSGAFKIVRNQLKQDSSKSPNPKPCSDALFNQVNSLREELQLLASNRSVTISTSGGSGSSGKYGLIVVVVVVVGYGYIQWKATKRHLSSRIDRVDSKIDECADNAAAIKEEVSEFRGEVRTIGDDLQSVHLIVQNLESKISRIEGRQIETNFGLGKLVDYARNLENTRAMEQIEPSASSSSWPALELPELTSSTVIHRGISDVVGMASGNSLNAAAFTSERTNGQNSSCGLFGRTQSAITRTC